jgi:serine/threonine protein kinase
MLDDRAVAGLRALVREPGPGDVLGDRFELREVIGEGGMGVVHAAFDRETSREVAVKVVRGDGGDGARFARECAVLAGVAHPAIVPYVARGTHEGMHWLAMDRLVGSTLAAALHRDGKLGIADTLALGRRVADALANAHHHGITHRDVKPSNLFLVDGAPAGVRLLDFGIARDLAAPPLTKTGALVGTPGYMAPEQARGERVTPAADVFALGCVLFECLVGRPAFTGTTTEILLAQILLEVPPPVREHRPDVPLALEGLVEQMLDKRATMRPSTDVVARELEALEAHLPTESGGKKPDPPALDLAEGDVVDKYRVERCIGQGGMGIVLAARHLELGTRVALKLLRGGDPTDAPRFLREAQAASRLESEHVARVIDVGRTAQGTPFIVMEYLSGTDLARRILEHGPIPIETAVGYVLEACEAVAEAHSLGIVHRDLKPSNLFVVSRRDGSELVKVLDFGISKLTRPLDGASAAASMTGASAVIGSASYMSPEQLASSKHVDARTDIWAMGVVLHELIAGSRPFGGESAAAVGARIASAPPRRLREIVSDAPEELETVILACLEKDPERRIANLALFAEALAPFADDAHQVSVERIVRVTGAQSAAAVGPMTSRRSARASSSPAGAAGAAAPAAPLPRAISRSRVVLGAIALVIAAGIGATITARHFEPASPLALATAVPPPTPSVEPSPPTIVASPAPRETPIAASAVVVASASPSAARTTREPPSSIVVAAPVRSFAPAPRPAIAPAPLPSTPSRRDLDLHDPALEGR